MEYVDLLVTGPPVWQASCVQGSGGPVRVSNFSENLEAFSAKESVLVSPLWPSYSLEAASGNVTTALAPASISTRLIPNQKSCDFAAISKFIGPIQTSLSFWDFNGEWWREMPLGVVKIDSAHLADFHFI